LFIKVKKSLAKAQYIADADCEAEGAEAAFAGGGGGRSSICDNVLN
jgi:hypothetical protein